MSPVRRVVAVGLCVPLLVLSACGDDPEAAPPDPTPTVTPTPTEEPDPRDEIPQEAREQSRDGAIRFVRYWVKVYNLSLRTLDGEPLRVLATDECETCRSLGDHFDRIREGGGRVKGGRISIREVGGAPDPPAGEQTILIQGRVGREVRTDSVGAEAVVAPAVDRNIEVGLTWVGDRWATTRVVVKQ